MKIASPTNWMKGQLVDYDIEMNIIKYDLCAALAQTFLDLNKQLPRKKLEDHILKGEDLSLMLMFNVFVDAWEEVHGPILRENGSKVVSTFAQVKLAAINDRHTHEELQKKLHMLVEALG